MNRVRVRKIVIGEGKPKIVVPIVAKTEAEMEEQLQKIIQEKADILEWRSDWFDGIFDWERVENALQVLRKYVGRYSDFIYFPYGKRRRRERYFAGNVSSCNIMCGKNRNWRI